MRESFSARRAAAIIAVFTLLVTVGGGISERLADRPEFPTSSKGLWFALQAVTTVGYGDVTPARVDGRIIAAIVILAGIGFIAVITAAVTAGLIESSRRRFAESERDLARRLEEVRELLVRIETGINQPAAAGVSCHRDDRWVGSRDMQAVRRREESRRVGGPILPVGGSGSRVKRRESDR